jgi:hypothetical protein
MSADFIKIRHEYIDNMLDNFFDPTISAMTFDFMKTKLFIIAIKLG